MLYLREIWHFKPKKLLHQGIVNGSIANFFAILLQYNSKHRIVLFTILQKNIFFLLLLFPPKFLSHPFHFFYSLLSLPSLFLHLLSPFWSFIAEISHPSPKFLTHLTQPLSHLSSHDLSLIAPVLGFGFLRLEVGGWFSVDRRAGFGSLGWDRLMVGLDRLINGFEMVDLLIGGWIVWVDHR